MKKTKDILPIVLKVALGVVFIVSAVLKIIDMDQFEIYVYSYHFFSLNFSFLVYIASPLIVWKVEFDIVKSSLLYIAPLFIDWNVVFVMFSVFLLYIAPLFPVIF